MTSRITAERARELLANATPGKWQRSGVRQNISENCIAVGPDGFLIIFLPVGRHPRDHAGAFNDAALAAAAPALATSLIAAEEEIAALRDKLSKAEKALEPFAAEAGEWPEKASDQNHLDTRHPFTVGDLRQACAALAAIREHRALANPEEPA